MSAYRLAVGLEIHAELRTATKMFCACRNDPDEKVPNKNVCAVCLAHPGTLPVINRDAVKKVLLVGKALGGALASELSEFDRKNYFYPDIPKGYQISQYAYPLVKGGSLGGVAVTRVHLEEDTARSVHGGLAPQKLPRSGEMNTTPTPAQGTFAKRDVSLVDYNRAGVPLMELVTEPVIASVEAAGQFARELQLLLRALGAGEANMEKGEMRVEANISVSKDDSLGTKVEVKNLNSFRSVERAISFELKRQSDLLESGGSVVQETRGWDEAKQQTFSQRKKERAHDYRYFPDPDLPKLVLSEVKELNNLDLPELPRQKRERLHSLGFLQEQDINQLVEDPELASLFGAVEHILTEPALLKIAANFILNDVAGQRKKDLTWSLPDAAHLAEIVKNYDKGLMASPQAKRAILTGKMVATFNDGALPAIAKKVVDQHPAVAADYKAGKEAALQFLVGQGMRESRGSANPQALREAIQKVLA